MAEPAAATAGELEAAYAVSRAPGRAGPRVAAVAGPHARRRRRRSPGLTPDRPPQALLEALEAAAAAAGEGKGTAGAGAEAEAARLAEKVGRAFRGFDGLCLRAEAALKAEEAAVLRALKAGAGTAAAGDVRVVLREFTAGLRRTGGAGGDAKATIS